jgi:hypothetical protein
MRDDLSAAGIYTRRMLGDAMARVESRLSKRRELREAVGSPDRTPSEHAPQPDPDSTAEVGRVLAQLVDVCTLLAERIDADRLERRALIEAIRRLAVPPVVTPESQTRVVGGTVFESSEIEPDVEIDRRDPDRHAVNGSPVDPSPDGTTDQSAEVNVDGANDLIQYWLRRESDGDAFPRALDAIDLHFLSAPPAAANIGPHPATAQPVNGEAPDLATRAAEWAQPPHPRQERDTFAPDDERPPSSETPGTLTKSFYVDRVKQSNRPKPSD